MEIRGDCLCEYASFWGECKKAGIKFSCRLEGETVRVNCGYSD